MADDQRSARRPFEVHVGERTPSNWAKREELAREVVVGGLGEVAGGLGDAAVVAGEARRPA